MMREAKARIVFWLKKKEAHQEHEGATGAGDDDCHLHIVILEV